MHGIEGHKNENWFPWLRRELEARGIPVWCETLPSPDDPILNEWVETVLPQVREGDILIGHSLGAPTMFRVAERLAGKKLKALISVAGFQSEPNYPGANRIQRFLKEGFNWKKIKNSAEKIYILDSDNDPYVALAEGEILQKKLKGERVTFSGRGHINRWGETKTIGEQTFPEILNIVLQSAS